jgi:predicted aspartyl protease
MRITNFLLCCLLVMVGGVAARAGEKQQVIEVPFEFYHNEIIVQVKVNGKGPFDMMLDTGTDPSAVDLNTAREMGLKLQFLGKPASGGGTDVNPTYYTKLPLVEVGGLNVKSLEAVALDLSKVSARLGKPLHGVLGHGLLNGRIVQIDYPNRIVRFYSQPLFSKTANTPTRTMLSFRYSDNVLVDDLMVNGKKMVGNLDTGSSGTFDLTPAAVSYLGLEEDFNQAPVSTDVGYNGVSQNRKGKVNNVTVGGISVDAPAVIFFGKGTGRDKKPWGINIGNGFFKDFILTIDYRNKLVTLERP